MINLASFSFIALTLLNFKYIQGSLVDTNDPYFHKEILDQNGRYQLEWLVNWPESRVHFNVTVRTKGYVGFGLSRKGKMSGADIVIGGVLPNGQIYFSDRHAVGNQIPVEDQSQDWFLDSAWESESHTFLSFSRSFETCDEQHDLVIDGDVVGIIWAFGEKDDDIEYHYQNRGVFNAYILDPDLTPRELQNVGRYGGILGARGLGNWNVWNISLTALVPVQDTTYVCSVHRSPVFRKQHIVGFRSILPTELEQRHIHHFLLHRCNPPEGQSGQVLFGHLEGYQEPDCYNFGDPTHRIPTQYCTEVVHVWAVGGRPNFYPDHVGIPLESNEYYLLQMHYDNPNLNSGIRLNPSLEVFYTDKLRKHDAAVFSFGLSNPASPTVMVPPNSINYQIYGHCAAGCTESMLPSSGVKVFAAYQHTHTTGQGVRTLHIRHNQELPWIAYDDNYNFNYQQIRVLREERVILPGDTVIHRCLYSNTDREGNVTIGGFSSREEMCAGFMWYYPKLPKQVTICRSQIRDGEYRNFLQIFNTTWSNERRENIVTSPGYNAGLLVSEVGNLKVNWNLENRKKLQYYHRYLPQVTQCPAPRDSRIEKNRENELHWNFLYKRGPPPLRRQSITGIRAPERFESGANRDLEFASVYPKNIRPYEKPSLCYHK